MHACAPQVDLGSCPSEVVERALHSMEQKQRSVGRLNPKDLVLKVAGKEEYMLEEKSISSYQVRTTTMYTYIVAEPHSFSTYRAQQTLNLQ